MSFKKDLGAVGQWLGGKGTDVTSTYQKQVRAAGAARKLRGRGERVDDLCGGVRRIGPLYAGKREQVIGNRKGGGRVR